MSTALFERDGERFVATDLSRGPWDPRACHGGPVSALLARGVERADAGGVEWQIARMTVELTRPVPVLTPLALDVVVERPGRKVSLVAVVLRDGEFEVARGRALRIRAEQVALPDDAHRAGDIALAAPSTGSWQRPMWATGNLPGFHTDACEHRFVEGSWEAPGPVGVWIRLRFPVIDDEAPTGVQRVAAAADFGNGVSASLDWERFVFINPDLTIHLLRPPVGEWVGMRTASRFGAAGAGLAESELFDADGRLGRSCQSLLIAQR